MATNKDKKQRLTPYPWIKVYAPKLLHGTMAGESPEHIGVFIKLLCLANEAGYRDGRLFTPPNKPMTREYISTTLNIPLDMLNEAIEYFKAEVNQDPTSDHFGSARMQELDGGMLTITNFADYQAKEDGKGKRLETARERELRERRELHLFAGRYPDEAVEVAKDVIHRENVKEESRKVAKSSEK